MKKLLYYFTIFISCVCFLTFTNYLSAKKIPGYNIPINDFVGASIFFMLIAIPYNVFVLLKILLVYYFNEIKSKTSTFSFIVAFFFAFIIVSAISIMIFALLNKKILYVLSIHPKSWITLPIFIVSSLVFCVVSIPIHNYFRKKFDFLNEAE